MIEPPPSPSTARSLHRAPSCPTRVAKCTTSSGIDRLASSSRTILQSTSLPPRNANSKSPNAQVWLDSRSHRAQSARASLPRDASVWTPRPTRLRSIEGSHHCLPSLVGRHPRAEAPDLDREVRSPLLLRLGPSPKRQKCLTFASLVQRAMHLPTRCLLYSHRLNHPKNPSRNRFRLSDLDRNRYLGAIPADLPKAAYPRSVSCVGQGIDRIMPVC